MTENQERRLAAIMFTDIVGSTAMMQNDESVAVRAVSKHKKTIEECAARHQGEVMNFYGDGSLTVFGSATSVLECAMDIQQMMQAEPFVPLRIGIHIGEILIVDGEVFGDGLNIASRIESLGQPGTVFFSDEVYRKIKNNNRFQATPLGEFHFKNVQEPMAVYALANEGFPVPDRSTITGKLAAGEQKQEIAKPRFGFKSIFSAFRGSHSAEQNFSEYSIAVLPFEDSGNPADINAESISDEIRSRLLAVKNLKVISRSSCQHFKEKKASIRKIGRELGVNYVLEGGIRNGGNTAQIYVELSHAPSDKLVWSMPSSRIAGDNLIKIQGEIASGIVGGLNLVLTPEEQTAIQKLPTTDTEAYHMYQKGMELIQHGNGFTQELQQARQYFKQAIEADQGFAKAWIGLADTCIEFIFWGRSAPSKMLDEAMFAAMKALEIAPDSGEVWGILGSVMYYRGERDKAREYLIKATQMCPAYLPAYSKLGWISNYEKNLADAIRYFSHAAELDPIGSRYAGEIGQSYFLNFRFDEGIEYVERALQKHPADGWLAWVLGLLYCGKSDYAKAIEVLQQRPTGQNNWLLGYALGKSGQTEEAQRILNFNLAKSALEYVPAYMLAVQYLGLDDIENTLKMLATDFEEGAMGANFWNLGKDPLFQPLQNNPQFLRVLGRDKG